MYVYLFQMINYPFVHCVIFRFNDEPGFERKILPQYDDPTVDEVRFEYYCV